MVRSGSIVFGIGLVFLGIVGITSPATTQFVAWINLVVGLAAIAYGSSSARVTPRLRRAIWPLVFSAVLFGLWVLELASEPAADWQAWWNFVFATGFLIVSIVAWSERVRSARALGPTQKPERPGRAA